MFVEQSVLDSQYQEIRKLTGGEFPIAVTSAKAVQGINELIELIDKATYAKHTQKIPESYQMNDSPAEAFKKLKSRCNCCGLWSRSPKPPTEVDSLTKNTDNDFGL